jgi:hypothetical protein
MYEQVRAAALQLAESVGLENLSRENVSEHAGIPPGSFSYHTGMRFSDFIEGIAAEGTVAVAPVTRRRQHPAVHRRSMAEQILEGLVSGELPRLTYLSAAKHIGTTPVTLRRYVGDREELVALLLSLDVVQQDPELAKLIKEA